MTPRDRRALIIFGTVAVAALVAYFLLLKPGGGGEQQAASGPSVTKTTPAPAPSAGKTHRTPRRSRPPALPPVGGHDPFSPLVNASAGGGTSPAPSSSGTSPPPSSSGPSPPPPVSPPGHPGSPPSGGAPAPACGA